MQRILTAEEHALKMFTLKMVNCFEKCCNNKLYSNCCCVGRILFFYLTKDFIFIGKHIINEFTKTSHFLTDYQVLRLSYMILIQRRHVTRMKAPKQLPLLPSAVKCRLLG